MSQQLNHLTFTEYSGPKPPKFNCEMWLTAEAFKNFLPILEVEIMQGEQEKCEDGRIYLKLNIEEQKMSHIRKQLIKNMFLSNLN